MGLKKDLISIRDLTKNDIVRYLRLAEKYENFFAKEKKHKIVVNAFFEPSTRTNMSFQTAAKRLGLEVLAFNVHGSSLAKGESFVDTIKILAGYSDALVIRHPLEGSARLAAESVDIPIINAGDGGNQHPSQTLLDLYTIHKLKGRIEGINVMLLGDLKYARVMNSLVYGLAMFEAEITLVSPKGLEMDTRMLDDVKEQFGANITQTNIIDLKNIDVLYICRIQKERFNDPYEAEKVQKEFRLTSEYLKNAKEDLVILHPLPKIDEIPKEIDSMKYAQYFNQAKNGIPVRMAIISDILRLEN